MTKFGVGYSELSNSFEAGIEAAKNALESSGISVKDICVCFIFCTSRHEALEYHKGVSTLISNLPFFGGFANGTITNTEFGYDGYQSVVGILKAKDVDVHLFKQEGIAFNEMNTGEALFKQISKTDFKTDPQILLFFDAVNRQKGRFQMNYVTPLLEGAKKVVTKWPNIAGARLMGDMKFKPTFQWFGDEVIQNSALALAFTGNIKMDVLRLEGCEPASSYHTVTENKGATILKIDGVPAAEFMGNMLGPRIKNDYEQMKFFVTLGKNLGDKWDRDKALYVNRMCVGVNPSNKGLVMAENDLTQGTEFQMMRRGFEKDLIQEKVETFLTKIKNEERKPVFALYLNCAGRARGYSQNETEDVIYVQNAIANEFPLLGIYEAGEIAKINEDLQVFDWTGVFCLFSENI